jgi:transposase
MKYYTSTKIAEILGVSPRTVLRYYEAFECEVERRRTPAGQRASCLSEYELDRLLKILGHQGLLETPPEPKITVTITVTPDEDDLAFL